VQYADLQGQKDEDEWVRLIKYGPETYPGLPEAIPR